MTREDFFENLRAPRIINPSDMVTLLGGLRGAGTYFQACRLSRISSEVLIPVINMIQDGHLSVSELGNVPSINSEWVSNRLVKAAEDAMIYPASIDPDTEALDDYMESIGSETIRGDYYDAIELYPPGSVPTLPTYGVFSDPVRSSRTYASQAAFIAEFEALVLPTALAAARAKFQEFRVGASIATLRDLLELEPDELDAGYFKDAITDISSQMFSDDLARCDEPWGLIFSSESEPSLFSMDRARYSDIMTYTGSGPGMLDAIRFLRQMLISNNELEVSETTFVDFTEWLETVDVSRRPGNVATMMTALLYMLAQSDIFAENEGTTQASTFPDGTSFLFYKMKSYQIFLRTIAELGQSELRVI